MFDKIANSILAKETVINQMLGLTKNIIIASMVIMYIVISFQEKLDDSTFIIAFQLSWFAFETSIMLWLPFKALIYCLKLEQITTSKADEKWRTKPTFHMLLKNLPMLCLSMRQQQGT